jgi:hypothetical protein
MSIMIEMTLAELLSGLDLSDDKFKEGEGSMMRLRERRVRRRSVSYCLHFGY